MSTSISVPTNVYTLSQRLADGDLPLAEALKYATTIAESLRTLHERGRVHGWVMPSTVAITPTGIELLEMPGCTDDSRYTAPEVLAGERADARSDIFSLGAVLRAMIAGKQALENEPAVRMGGMPTAAALERFLGQCLASDPAARPQRIQKVLLELKFFMLVARRTDAQSAGITVREISRTLDEVSRRLVAAEQEIEALRRHSAVLEEQIAANLRSHEHTLEAHAAAISSTQNSTEQTDSLVERMVEALDLLQSTLIDPQQPGVN